MTPIQNTKEVLAIIREGHHSPSFLGHLVNFKIWLFWTPSEFVIDEGMLEEKTAEGNWIPLKQRSYSDVSNNGELYEALIEEKSKFGGVQYGFPKRTKNKKSWNYNSARLAFDLFLRYWKYIYENGVDYTGSQLPDAHFEFVRWYTFPKWLAWRLLPYFGGTIPAPCNIRISYKVTYIVYYPNWIVKLFRLK